MIIFNSYPQGKDFECVQNNFYVNGSLMKQTETENWQVFILIMFPTSNLCKGKGKLFSLFSFIHCVLIFIILIISFLCTGVFLQLKQHSVYKHHRMPCIAHHQVVRPMLPLLLSLVGGHMAKPAPGGQHWHCQTARCKHDHNDWQTYHVCLVCTKASL